VGGYGTPPLPREAIPLSRTWERGFSFVDIFLLIIYNFHRLAIVLCIHGGKRRAMETPAVIMQEYYIKERGRRWFWAMLAFLGFEFIFMFFYSPLTNIIININHEAYLAVSIAVSLFFGAAQVVLLLGFSRNSVIRLFSILFLALACANILVFASGLMTTLMIYFSFKASETNALLGNIGGILSIAYCAISIASYIIFAFNKRSGTALKVPSLLVALYQLYSVAYLFFGFLVMRSIIGESIYDFALYTIVTQVIGTINNFISMSLGIYFFAAYSFSKMKPLKGDSRLKADIAK
jgi:hypothetical protein